MKLLNWLKRNSAENKKWEETEAGKRFYDKIFADCKKRNLKEEEWEKNTPPEKKEQVKLFKILFTAFFISFSAVLVYSFHFYKELIVLTIEGAVALVSFFCFLKKLRIIKYPNCFMMPVIAFFCTLLIYLMLGFNHGFNPQKRKETDSTEYFFGRDYTKFLKENEIETEKELQSDFNNWKE